MISDVFAIIDWSKSRTLPELVKNFAQDGVFEDSGNVLNNYIDVEKVIRKLKSETISPRKRA